MTFTYLKQREYTVSCIFCISGHLQYEKCICAATRLYITIAYEYA